MKILYEDNHLLVVIKPEGVPSQADDSRDDDMLTLLKAYIKEKYNKLGEVYLGLVHRLDRPVGGVMVFARTSKAAARLSQQLKDGRFKKTYILRCQGVPDGNAMCHYLLKDRRTNTVKAVAKDIHGAKEARLEYKVLSVDNNNALCQVNLLTGRSHQIRVQFSTSNHPLINDMRYNKNAKAGNWIALRSQEITIEHPTKKDEMTFVHPDRVTF